MLARSRAFRCYATVALLALGAVSADAARNAWPWWRGPQRDGTTPEDSGWEAGTWPPTCAWEVSVGKGASSPIVAEGRVYAMGWANDRDRILCLDARTGQELWRQEYQCPPYGRWHRGDENFYGGPSSTPTFDAHTGLLFTLSCDGDLCCWDARAQGRPVWRLNLYQTYGVPQRPDVGGGMRDYGYTTAPLLCQNWIIVEVGSPRGTLIAFDMRTGEQVWTSEHTGPPGHSGGLVPTELDGEACVLVVTLRELLAVGVGQGQPGRTLARYPWITHFANSIPTPAVKGQCVILTAAQNVQRTVRLRLSRWGVRKVWQSRAHAAVCSPVIVGRHVYLVGGQLFCLDMESGRQVWAGGNFGDDASIAATVDGRLVVLGNRRLSLVEGAERSPNEYRELSTVQAFEDGYTWPHVTVADGSALVRNLEGRVRCFALR